MYSGQKWGRAPAGRKAIKLWLGESLRGVLLCAREQVSADGCLINVQPLVPLHCQLTQFMDEPHLLELQGGAGVTGPSLEPGQRAARIIKDSCLIGCACVCRLSFYNGNRLPGLSN